LRFGSVRAGVSDAAGRTRDARFARAGRTDAARSRMWVGSEARGAPASEAAGGGKGVPSENGGMRSAESGRSVNAASESAAGSSARARERTMEFENLSWRTPTTRSGSVWARFRAGVITWPALGLFTVIGSLLLGAYNIEKSRKTEELRKSHTKTVAGKAKLGGDWELVSCADNKPRRNTDYLGRFVLIYFGFTFCPDICPDELDKISEALTSLGDNRKFVQPLFISIDPERDTPERIRNYLKDFHPDFEGLTGSLEECKATAKLFRVYFSKDNTVGDDYLVDHSIITYLMDPTGEFLEFYGKAVSPSDMCLRLNKLIMEYKTQLRASGKPTDSPPPALSVA